MLNKEYKQKLIDEFKISENDTGSCEVQLAIVSARIKEISEHLKSFPKDKHSRRGLLKLVGRRKSFLDYLKKKDHDRYEKILSGLEKHK